jgi:hypothetical protein
LGGLATGSTLRKAPRNASTSGTPPKLSFGFDFCAAGFGGGGAFGAGTSFFGAAGVALA